MKPKLLFLNMAKEERLARRRVFRVEGMCCQDEILALKRSLGTLVGGDEHLHFDLVNSKMVVDTGANRCSDEEIISTVSKMGLKAQRWEDSKHLSINGITRDSLFIFSVTISALFLVAGFVVDVWYTETFGVNPAPFLYGGCAFLGFWRVLPKALAAIRSMRPDMNLLMVIAVSGAFLIGELFEGAMVSFLFAVSLLLESWSMQRARTAVEGLLSAAPNRVMVLIDGGRTRAMNPSEVVVGSLFLVKPGEIIPLDGEIVEGAGEINQAPITGESVPVAKGCGDTVFAGTVNSDGTLSIRSTKPAEDTTLATIARLVSEAQLKRSPSEKFVERFARVYTPSVILIALLVAILPPLFLGYPALDWVYRALVLLVVACPCALVISTPVSIVSGLTSAARKGVLIKGGEYLEASAYLKAVAVDKTGTLTKGEPQVVDLVPLNGHDESELLERAASLEASSQHPIATAIVSEARDRGIEFPRCTEFRNYPGKGSIAKFKNKKFWIGSHRFMEEMGQETPEVHEVANSLAEQGYTVVTIGNEEHVCGLITVADLPREGAGKVVESLRQRGVEIVMLTGDNLATATAIGKKLGISNVFADLLPNDKIELVQRMNNDYDSVAMVGDGINDAPAMAQATVGIAMGTAGSDLAIETADVALMSDELANIPWLIDHAKKTLSIIKQNIVLSLATKGIVLALSIVGYASLWAAIAADAGTSLLVIANGLRALKSSG